MDELKITSGSTSVRQEQESEARVGTRSQGIVDIVGIEGYYGSVLGFHTHTHT